MAKAKTDRLQVRISTEEKERAMQLFDGLGLSISDAVILFIRKSLIADGLPFSVDYSNPNKSQENFKNSI